MVGRGFVPVSHIFTQVSLRCFGQIQYLCQGMDLLCLQRCAPMLGITGQDYFWMVRCKLKFLWTVSAVELTCCM